MAISIGATQADLILSFQRLRAEINKLANAEELESIQATHAATELTKIAEQFRDALCDSTTPQSLESRLSEKEALFPMAYRMVHILGQPEIQCYHSLKEQLSKTTRIIFELVVFQLALQKQRLYTDTVVEIKSKFEKVRSTLPKEAVITHFEIECAEAATQKIDMGIGKWKEIAGASSLGLIGGAIETLGTASSNPPFISPAPLIRPVIETCCAVYKALEESWYKDIWALKWLSPKLCIRTITDFQVLKPLYEKYQSNHQLAFYLSQLCMQIIHSSQAEDALKVEVFSGKEMSLTTLAQYRPATRDKFWRTRYVILKQFKTLIEEKAGYQDGGAYLVTATWVRSKEKRVVRALAGSIIADLAPKNPVSWKLQLQKLELEKKRRDVQADLQQAKAAKINRESLKKHLNDLDEQIDKLERELRSQFGPMRQSNMRGPRNDVIVKADLNAVLAAKQDCLAQEERFTALEEQDKAISIAERALKDEEWELFRI